MIFAANSVDCCWNAHGWGGGGNPFAWSPARSAANAADGAGGIAAPHAGQDRLESGTCLLPQLRHALIYRVRIIPAGPHINGTPERNCINPNVCFGVASALAQQNPTSYYFAHIAAAVSGGQHPRNSRLRFFLRGGGTDTLRETRLVSAGGVFLDDALLD